MGSNSATTDGEHAAAEERCSVEEVALVVPETDDPNLPVMTFRAWVLGLASCTVLIFLNTFFIYRTQPLSISAILMQIAVLPIGRFMAATLPEKQYTLFGRWGFSLNPGPFNIKEHVIITVMANCGVSMGGGDAYSIGAITVMKAYYKQSLNFLCALLIVLTTQFVGYGWAGMLRRYLVDPVEMWWPSNLAQVSLFRALHEREHKSNGMTRMRFFLICMTASFIYYLFPGYLFQILTFFSWVCWVWPRSITAQQIGSGYHGLGVGAFTLDWAGISAYHGSPLVTPFSSILNVMIGFIMFIYIIVPLCYWKYNTFDARKFPIFSNQLFTSSGHKYDTTKILTPQYDLNISAYERYSKLYLSPLFALSIGSGFARFTATLTHVALFHGSDIWKQSKSAVKNVKLDIHAKLMKSYKQVPEWWFLILLAASIALSVLMTFVWKDDVQLPWWGMLFAFGLAWIVTLPIGVIQATTNQQPGYDIIAQFIFGYILPGKPIANLLFKIYGRISTIHALSFLADLKLGCRDTSFRHGQPRSGMVDVGKHRQLMRRRGIASREPPGLALNSELTFERFFPVWILSKIFPDKKWIALINIPVISYGFAGMPPATPTNIASWIITGTIFNYFVFKYRKTWWQRYNYVLSAALDAGTAFMGVLLFFALQNNGKDVKWWGSEPDHCPLATCPTAPGIVVAGCPVFR
ncbi:oligopeptide transporter 3 [Phtheirospermum japonicum]|uniref:Oligopeptide transporter 3 n=1 Tax=Phtheirospermum japonicum TaxID=374723 RepID=A0A830B5B4_9LAMI|nr:oligopeptide transporter 3 [Phtheirospermum japonicum]